MALFFSMCCYPQYVLELRKWIEGCFSDAKIRPNGIFKIMNYKFSHKYPPKAALRAHARNRGIYRLGDIFPNFIKITAVFSNNEHETYINTIDRRSSFF